MGAYAQAGRQSYTALAGLFDVRTVCLGAHAQCAIPRSSCTTRMGCTSSRLCGHGHDTSHPTSRGAHSRQESMGGKASVPAKQQGPDAPAPSAKGALQQADVPQHAQQVTACGAATTLQQQAASTSAGVANPAITNVAAMDTPRSVDSDLAMVDRLLVQNTKSQIQNARLVLTPDPHSAAGGPSNRQPWPAQEPSPVQSPRAPSSPEQHAPPKQQMSTVGEAGGVLSVDPTDPWAALQSAYRIDAGRASPVKQVGKDRSSAAARAVSTANQAGILVLDDDDDTGGRYSNNIRQGGKKLAAKPVQGGWGKGAMAQAGTLMVGEEELLGHLAPPHTLPAAAPSPPKADPEEEYAQLRSRIKASAVQTDLGIEDLEDIDDLLKAEEERAGLKPSLAAKLAAFEALAGEA